MADELGGQTLTVDNVVDTFTVSVRSLSGVSIDTIKRLLQSRHEVISIEHKDRVISDLKAVR